MTSDADPRDLDTRSASPGPPSYLIHLARDSARFAQVLGQAPARKRVPSCPDWDADDLLWHLADVQWFWGTIVGRGLTTAAEIKALVHEQRPDNRADLLACFDRASTDLQQALSAASPETSAWTWSEEQTVGFICRRQAHEALIHRLDAELTVGGRTTMDAELSADGVDEALRIMYAGAPPWGRFTPDPTQTVRVQSPDTGSSWLLTLGRFTGTEDDGTVHDEPDLQVEESDSGQSTAVTITGAAADLDCWLWRRPSEGRIERAGDPRVLDPLDQIIAQAAG